MIVYLIGFILTIILLYISEYKVKAKRKKFLLRVVAVLPLLVISAIRYNVGTDYDKRYDTRLYKFDLKALKLLI